MTNEANLEMVGSLLPGGSHLFWCLLLSSQVCSFWLLAILGEVTLLGGIVRVIFELRTRWVINVGT
jgi:hypothetical protein